MSLILNGTSGVSDVDGSASTPAIRGTDTNTGIFFPATDTIAFAEGGAEVARFDSNGNLGIGTSSPISDAKLTISAPLEPILFFQRSDAGNNDAAIHVSSGGAFIFKNGADSSTAAGLTERMRIDGSGNLLFNSGYGSVATAYGCRAWVNFNGTGTVAIRGSGNVSSVTDNGTGEYTVNFSTAMPDANYAGVLGGNLAGSNDGTGRIGEGFYTTGTYTASSCRIRCIWQGDGSTAEDKQIINLAVFR